MNPTAVEWLVEQLKERGYAGEFPPHLLFEQAKQMEKEQQERMYSEEDLKEAFKGGGKMSWTDINQETQEPYYYDFNEWFEQFKNK